MDVVAVIMGGGRGTRLRPLTRDRSKPAVPLAGKYRLVDVPISNCVNSNILRIYLLTQFNSASLHKHVQDTYTFPPFARGFVRLLAAQQTPGGDDWYQGTADAVRQNLHYFLAERPEAVVILSGDQLYRMDLAGLVERHMANQADVTVCTTPVGREETGGFGIMSIDAKGRINAFVEKPSDPGTLDGLRSPLHPDDEKYLASMGIYVFKPDVLSELLASGESDFGGDIIPAAIGTRAVFADVFEGYWRDIGTIRSFWEENLALTADQPEFSLYDRSAPIYTHMRFLPPSKMVACDVQNSLLAEGCILEGARLSRSVIGVRARVGRATTIENTFVMGSDYFPHEERSDLPNVGIGCECTIRDAIIDKGARIGCQVTITPDGKADGEDTDLYSVRDGVIVIPKNAVIPTGTVL
jgi:glucose-1-phosphate adenylyltransferase